MPYVLHRARGEADVISIIKMLHMVGVEARPRRCVDSSPHPPEVTELPAILDEDTRAWHVGLAACVAYLEALSGVEELLVKSQQFRGLFPDYRMR